MLKLDKGLDEGASKEDRTKDKLGIQMALGLEKEGSRG